LTFQAGNRTISVWFEKSQFQLKRKGMGTMRQKRIFVSMVALCLPLVLTGCDKGAGQKAELESVKAELEAVKAASVTTETERDDLKDQVTVVSKARNELQVQIAMLTLEDKRLRDQVDVLTTSDKSLTDQVTGLTTSNEQLTEQLKEVTGSRDQLKGEVDGLKTSSEGLQAQVHELTRERDAAIAKTKETFGKLAVLTAKLKAATGAEPEPPVPPTVTSVTPVNEDTPKVEAAKGPTIHSFDAARARISKGQSASLSWHVSNADRISIEPEVGSVSALGSKNVKPPRTTTYTLTATNKDGETVQTCRIEVR